MAVSPGSIKPLACCEHCAHFATVHHGGRGGRPGSAPCTNPTEQGGVCNCPKFVKGTKARMPVEKDLLTPAELAKCIGLSVHTSRIELPVV